MLDLPNGRAHYGVDTGDPLAFAAPKAAEPAVWAPPNGADYATLTLQPRPIPYVPEPAPPSQGLRSARPSRSRPRTVLHPSSARQKTERPARATAGKTRNHIRELSVDQWWSLSLSEQWALLNGPDKLSIRTGKAAPVRPLRSRALRAHRPADRGHSEPDSPAPVDPADTHGAASEPEYDGSESSSSWADNSPTDDVMQEATPSPDPVGEIAAGLEHTYIHETMRG
ncbi:uncharacterized protein V1510DRAFT_416378 [Dipodascopsis tothii]|uniref:uncharacterized protein n=1 Tax=Dipodascopsis tothii TaxID=44089 RepID=UPI0034CE7B0E